MHPDGRAHQTTDKKSNLLDALDAVQPRASTVNALNALEFDTESYDHHFPQLLQVAFTHTSHFGLKPPEYAGLPNHILDVLRTLGNSAIDLAIALTSFDSEINQTANQISVRGNELRKGLPAWASRLQWLRNAAIFGGGFQIEKASEAVLDDIFRQVVGAFSFFDYEAPIYNLARDYSKTCADILTRPVRLVDLKLTLVEQTKPHQPRYEYASHGPEHDKTHVATVSTPDGRSASAIGATKKQASNKAAEIYLRQYYSQSLKAPAVQRDPSDRRLRQDLPEAHIRTVNEVSRLFGVQPPLMYLLSEALIHSSWLYENRKRFPRLNDNSVLAFIGAAIQQLIYVRSIAESYFSGRITWEQFRVRSLKSEMVASAFKRLNLQNAFLVGRTHDRSGPSEEMMSNAVQAVLAVIFVANGGLRSTEDQLRSKGLVAFKVIAPGRLVEDDPTTDLQELLVVSDVEWVSTWSETQIPHSPSPMYSCTLTLTTSGSGGEITVSGVPATSKRRARHEAARVIRDAVHSLRNIATENRADQQTFRICSFILAQLIESPPTQQKVVRKWVQLQLLGTNFLRDAQALRLWARQTSKIYIPPVFPAIKEVDRVVQFYQIARQVSGASIPPLNGYIDEVSQWITGIDTLPNRLQQVSQWKRLLKLCDGFRVRTLKGEFSHLTDVLSQREIGNDKATALVSLADQTHDTLLMHPTAEALTNVLEFWRSKVDAAGKARGLSVSDGTPTTRVEFPFSSTWADREDFIELVRIMADSAVGISFEIRSGAVTLEIANMVAPEENSFLESAAVRSTLIPTGPIDFAFAHTLHDLKNLLTAAEVASYLSRSNSKRSDEHRRAAVLHIARAQELAARLGKAASLLSRTVAGNTELNAFFDSYLRRMGGALPSSIKFILQRVSTDCYVSIHEDALGEILDNMVRNSVEAMPNGGCITVEWTDDHDEGTVLILVGDTGPGIPESVLQTIRSGEEVKSTKPDGSGLGLQSVISLLQRVGGNLDGSSDTTGASWVIELPISDM